MAQEGHRKQRAINGEDSVGKQILQLRFVDDLTVVAVDHRVNLSPDQVNRRQRAALEQLTEVLLVREQALRAQLLLDWEAGLQAPNYSQLYGVTTLQKDLEHLLLAQQAPWLLAITGLGGIGKSALTDAAVRNILPAFHFHQVVWVRIDTFPASNGQGLPQLVMDALAENLLPADTPAAERAAMLTTLLKTAPHLIVLDNLDAIVELDALVAWLLEISNPTRFVLTSRQRPSLSSGIYMCGLQELDLDDACRLLVNHAEQVGLGQTSAEIERYAEDIFAVIGGHPLALKLVVGLLAVLPLSAVLEDFKVSRLQDVNAMYRHIYWKIWQALTPSARTLLQAMPLISEQGGDLAQLGAISGLREEDLTVSVHELFNRSLLERRGALQAHRYGIHHLTAAFLLTEIINWPDTDSD